MNKKEIIKIGEQNVEIELLPTSIEGLMFEPKSINIDNDRDLYFRQCSVEVSDNNFNLVESLCDNFMTDGILEIGVSRNGVRSFTQALLNKKPDHIKYVGVDLEDKTYLNNVQKNIFTIKENSFNIEKVQEYLQEIQMNEISILLIDGWHSINAVLNDWKYTSLLSKNAVVIFHDTNYHPGPAVVTKYIDTNKYRVEKYFEEMDDYGIVLAFKK